MRLPATFTPSIYPLESEKTHNNQAAVPGPGQTYNTFEGNLLTSWKWVTFKFNYAFTDYFGASPATNFTDDTNGTYYVQLDAAYPLAAVQGLSLVGHVGYTHYSAQLNPPGVNNGQTDPSYWDLKLGVSYVWKDGCGYTAGGSLRTSVMERSRERAGRQQCAVAQTASTET